MVGIEMLPFSKHSSKQDEEGILLTGSAEKRIAENATVRPTEDIPRCVDRGTMRR